MRRQGIDAGCRHRVSHFFIVDGLADCSRLRFAISDSGSSPVTQQFQSRQFATNQDSLNSFHSAIKKNSGA
jgi:hypothetical protein